MRAHRWRAICLIVATVGLVSSVAAAQSDRHPGRKIWVPQGAWNAIAARAALDMNTSRSNVRLYKTGGTNNMTRGLENVDRGGKAYVVKTVMRDPGMHGFQPKMSGLYLALKGNVGWEAFPLANAARVSPQGVSVAKRSYLTKVDGRVGANTYAFATGELGPTKVVQGVLAKNTSVAYSTSEGQIVARKTMPARGKTAERTVYFVLGKPGEGANPPSASVELLRSGTPTVPNPVLPRPTEVKTKFLWQRPVYPRSHQ